MKSMLFGGIGFVPDIPALQRFIEQGMSVKCIVLTFLLAAWARGIDRAGCAQLGGRLSGTSLWIGAVEVLALSVSVFR